MSTLRAFSKEREKTVIASIKITDRHLFQAIVLKTFQIIRVSFGPLRKYFKVLQLA